MTRKRVLLVTLVAMLIALGAMGMRARSVAAAGGQVPFHGSYSGTAILTSREVELLRLLASGLSRREVARQLFLSEHTVRHHLEHIYDKIGVRTRVAATLFAVEHDLLN